MSRLFRPGLIAMFDTLLANTTNINCLMLLLLYEGAGKVTCPGATRIRNHGTEKFGSRRKKTGKTGINLGTKYDLTTHVSTTERAELVRPRRNKSRDI